METHVVEEEEERKEPVGDYRYELQDPRLLASHQLLLRAPELIYQNPRLAAAAFGIRLGELFFVSDVGKFTDDMTLQDHFSESRIRYVSPKYQQFLQPVESRTLLDMPWDDMNSPNFCYEIIREAVNMELPVYGIRQWEHLRRITVNTGRYSCLFKGYILSNLKVMFVDCVSRERIVEDVTPEDKDFVWDDLDVFGLSNSGDTGFDFDIPEVDLFGPIGNEETGNQWL